ncbi:MAG: nitroreductase [Methanomicrobiales archaeon]|nr:nitroreductase [Methanomicrobiales archaeon]
MDSSEFREFLRSRSSVREFAPDPVPEEQVRWLLSCASTAPSAGNLEAWDVVAVTDPEVREALAEAALSQPHVTQAPLVLVVCSNYVRSMSRYGERGILYGLEDATIACTYLMLAAHADGLSSCWTGAFDDEEVRRILDLPAHVRPVALLAVGHGRPGAERTGRMPPEDHLHLEEW